MPKYRLSKVAGRKNWHIVWSKEGKTKRESTGTEDRAEAEAAFEDFLANQPGTTKPEQLTTGKIIEAYIKDREQIILRPDNLWSRYKAVKRPFGMRLPQHITRDKTRRHIEKRRKQGRSDGTIRDELALISAALKYAEREKWIDRAPYIELPPSPPPKDRWLTREEVNKLLYVTKAYHIKLFIKVALATASRSTAILELEWDRVDMEKRRIELNVPGRPRTKKGRATVPINDDLYEALLEAQERATCDHVIEWGGHQCESVKKGFGNTAKRAGFTDVSPHTLRHTAATWMAQAGVSMWEIAGMLGHKDSRITERVYAKHSPEYLQNAAKALNLKKTG